MYRKALPELDRDFSGRCAYCMQHKSWCDGIQGMEVDHFDPARKDDPIQDYSNLFLASPVCNGAKLDHWPSADELAAGMRFLNCCLEADYGVHIIEDPATNLLTSTTRAGAYHVLFLDLNRPDLVEARRVRASLSRDVRNTPILLGDLLDDPDRSQAVAAVIGRLQDVLDQMIPHIPAAPVCDPPPDPVVSDELLARLTDDSG